LESLQAVAIEKIKIRKTILIVFIFSKLDGNGFVYDLWRSGG
jgi:hypothetical protein